MVPATRNLRTGFSRTVVVSHWHVVHASEAMTQNRRFEYCASFLCARYQRILGIIATAWDALSRCAPLRRNEPKQENWPLWGVKCYRLDRVLVLSDVFTLFLSTIGASVSRLKHSFISQKSLEKFGICQTPRQNHLSAGGGTKNGVTVSHTINLLVAFVFPILT